MSQYSHALSPFTPSIHPAYARLLVGHLISRGIDVGRLFEESNLDWEALILRQRFISFSQFSAIAEKGMALTDCPWLGLEISSIIQVSSHGPLGYGAIASPNLRLAVKLIEKMMPTRILLYEFMLKEDADFAHLCVDESLNVGRLSEFIQVMLFGSFMDLLEKSGVILTQGVVAEFSFLEPDWRDRYQARYPMVEFRFGCESMSVSIPVTWLDCPCLTADEFAYRNALRECETLILRDSTDGVLSRQLTQRFLDAPAGIPPMEDVALELGVSVRTLIRRLKQEGVTYQGLVDEVRQDIATWLLLNTSDSVEAIAESVGFLDTSNFARVFRRWFNVTPSEFRSHDRS